MRNSNSGHLVALFGATKWCAPAAFVCAVSFTAHAEPAAHLMFVKAETGECGTHITGGAGSGGSAVVRQVIDRAFIEFQAPKGLDAVLSGDVEQDCKSLGYRYVGILPAKVTPCYPWLGELLGGACSPEVWFRVTALAATLVLMLSIAMIVIRKRKPRHALRETEEP